MLVADKMLNCVYEVNFCLSMILNFAFDEKQSKYTFIIEFFVIYDCRHHHHHQYYYPESHRSRFHPILYTLIAVPIISTRNVYDYIYSYLHAVVKEA